VEATIGTKRPQSPGSSPRGDLQALRAGLTLRRQLGPLGTAFNAVLDGELDGRRIRYVTVTFVVAITVPSTA
jgi:hypothetical protein